MKLNPAQQELASRIFKSMKNGIDKMMSDPEIEAELIMNDQAELPFMTDVMNLVGKADKATASYAGELIEKHCSDYSINYAINTTTNGVDLHFGTHFGEKAGTPNDPSTKYFLTRRNIPAAPSKPA